MSNRTDKSEHPTPAPITAERDYRLARKRSDEIELAVRRLVVKSRALAGEDIDRPRRTLPTPIGPTRRLIERAL